VVVTALIGLAGGKESRESARLDSRALETREAWERKREHLAEAAVVDVAGVGRGAGDKELGAVKDGVLLHHVIVDGALALIEAVGKALEVDRDS
jgi:hypothetical protein